jgi:hypothetical protein
MTSTKVTPEMIRDIAAPMIAGLRELIDDEQWKLALQASESILISLYHIVLQEVVPPDNVAKFKDIAKSRMVSLAEHISQFEPVIGVEKLTN